MSGGRTGGRPSGVHTTYNKFRHGSVTLGVEAQALLIIPLASELRHCFEVLLVANPDNAGMVWVGNPVDGCHIPLPAGASKTHPINDISKIHVRGDVAGDVVHWEAAVESA